MTTTADGYLTVEGDRLSVGVPREAGLPLGFLLVFGVSPVMTLFSLLLLVVIAPGSTGGGLLLLLVSALLVLGPGLVGVAQMLLSARGGRRREVRIDLGEWLIERPGKSTRALRRPKLIRIASRGLEWRLSMDDEVLARAPYFAGHSLSSAATRLAEAMECELEIPPAARRARLPLPRNPRVLAAMAYLPFDPVAVPLSLWILATSTHNKTRFAAAQSLVLEVLEVGLLTALLVVFAVPLLLVGPPAALLVLLCPVFAVALLRTALRGALSLRAGRGVVTVVFGLGWLVGRWAPPSAKPAAPVRLADPPVPAPRRPPPAQGAGGLGPWWT